MRLLIIEDENKTATYLAKGLSENGFIVDIATDGEDGLFQAMQTHYDIMVVDVMLPKVTGWEIVKKIRQTMDKDVRILFLTARDSIEDKVKGLELGADDYLIKPFAFSELLARIRSLLRRGSSQQSEKIVIADLIIDLLRHKAMRGTTRLDLSPKEFSLLTFMAQHTGEVLSRTLIAERVWDIHFNSDTNVIDVAIRRLRQKVDDDFEIKFIHTVRGIGYVFEVR